MTLTLAAATAAWPAVLERLVPTIDGCLVWPHAQNSKGYGQVSIDGTVVLVHRLALLVRDGAIPAGYVSDHTCHDPATCPGRECIHRLCANPEHLEPVTVAENSRRGHQQNRSTCKRNHPLSTRHRAGKDVRCCRTCERERRHEQQLRLARAEVSA